jgi:DNA-binding HxlR family transcriptional regulator
MNTNHDNCPVARVATLLSDPWTMLIIRDLLKKEMRFCDLERSLTGISTRTLTNKLRHLEENNIIKKKDLSYAITPEGIKLKKVLKAMEAYGNAS